jgi:poly(A) polymerase
MELLALLALPNPAPTLALMIESGIFKPVLPEVTDAAPVARLVVREAEAGIAPDALRRLCALIAPDPIVAEDIANRLKLSNAQRKRMVAVAGRADEDAKDPRALAYWQGVEVAVDRLLLRTGDAKPLLGWTPPRFPITGGAIVARGVQAGPEVARILQAAERQWVAEGFPDSARAAALIDGLIKA